MKILNISKIKQYRAVFNHANFSEKVASRPGHRRMELVKIYEYNNAEVEIR
jgi:hypothetical protein